MNDDYAEIERLYRSPADVELKALQSSDSMEYVPFLEISDSCGHSNFYGLSTIRLRLKNGTLIPNVHMRVKGKRASAVMDGDFIGLCRLFGIVGEVNKNDQFYDWKPILSVFSGIPGLGATISGLNELCRRMKLPIRYNQKAHKVFVCNNHFRQLFQTFTKIRLSPCEGGHRTWILCRIFAGFSLDEYFPTARLPPYRTVADDSTLTHMMVSKFLYVKDIYV